MHADRLRKALVQRGLTPATAVPDASRGRAEEATIRPARLLEDAELGAHQVGPAEAWAEPVAFLDGTQRMELVGYAGASPLLLVTVAAAVRERRERTLATVLVERRTRLMGRPSALAAAGDAAGALSTAALPEDEPPHPVRDQVNAARLTDNLRGSLELELGTRYRAQAPHWLVVDGSLAESSAWAQDARMVGVAKSHAALPFDGAALERYLRLPAGHRSSLFVPASRRGAAVHAWALRLWAWDGKDLLHGLIRVEVAPANGTPEMADRISRWLLAERAPVSAPDPRWDRLLYGIHAVEEYLRASSATSLSP